MSGPAESPLPRSCPTSPAEEPTGERARRARATLRRILHRPRARPAAREPTAEEQEARAATTEALGELREELAFERQEVLEPLLHRLQEFAERLAHEEEIPPPAFEEGLDLWQAYVERLHDAHIRAMASVGARKGASEGDDLTLAELEHDPPRAQARIGEIRAMLAGYAEGYRVFGGLMSPAIRGNTLSELAWEKLEEEFLGIRNPPPLSAAARDRLLGSLAATRRTAEELRRRIQAFLERTAQFGAAGPVTASAPAAAARASA